MIGGAFCISVSPLSRPRNGPLRNCARLSRGETAPRYRLRDRDKIFGPDFVKQVKAMGIKKAAPRSPWQRAYIERVIGTLRRECLDHVIIFSEAGSGWRHAARRDERASETRADQLRAPATSVLVVGARSPDPPAWREPTNFLYHTEGAVRWRADTRITARPPVPCARHPPCASLWPH